MARTYRHLSMKLSTINCLGYMTAVIGPSIMDPLLSSHVKYGSREYQYTFYLAALAPVIYLLFYFYLRKSTFHAQFFRRSLIPSIALLGPALYFLLPEFPHMGFAVIFVATQVLSSLTYFIYASKVPLSFMDDTTIELSARIEYLKTSFDFWKTLTITGMAAYLAFSIVWVDRVKKSVAEIVVAPKEQFILNNGALMLIIFFTAGVVIGPLSEALKNMTELREAFKRVRSAPNQAMKPTDRDGG